MFVNVSMTSVRYKERRVASWARNKVEGEGGGASEAQWHILSRTFKGPSSSNGFVAMAKIHEWRIRRFTKFSP